MDRLPEVANRSRQPSGGARLTSTAAICPSAPGLLSMMTGLAIASATPSLIRRATASVLDPAGKGATTVSVLQAI